jgi:hypothetical protein
MRVILIQSEIEQAIKDYVLGQLAVADGMDIAISLKAGRGEEGFTADIDFTKKVEEAPVLTLASTPRRGRPPLSKNSEVVNTKEVVETAQVEEPETSNQEVENATQEAGTQTETTEKTVQEELTEEQPVARPAGSLFAGLKRPSNS